MKIITPVSDGGFFIMQHSSSQQPLIGFILVFLAILMWGALPLSLQMVLKELDSPTIVWFRFVSAMVGISLLLGLAKKLPKLTTITLKQWGLLAIGIIGLAGNFLLFNLALRYIPATASQVISPLSSFAMILLGVVLFKERMGIHQKLGLMLLFIGLPLFFNDRFADFKQMNSFAVGIVMSISASLMWLGYGITQKLLLKHFSSQQILLIIYTGCSLLFTPMANISQIAHLSPTALAALLFAGLNTIVAYGCYAEALNRWEVANVSMVMTQIPVITLIFAHLGFWFSPTWFAEPHLNGLSYFGGGLVVLGALSAAVGHKLFYRNQLSQKRI